MCLFFFYKFLGSPHVISEEPHVGETMPSLPKSAGTVIATDGTPCTGMLQ